MTSKSSEGISEGLREQQKENRFGGVKEREKEMKAVWEGWRERGETERQERKRREREREREGERETPSSPV